MDNRRLLHIFCDWSNDHAEARYMVFGGIVVDGSLLDGVNREIGLWRETNNMMSELKWTKVSTQKFPEYQSLINHFFSKSEQNVLHFKAVVFDKSQIDYRTFHENSKEMGRYKFFYQFILHKFSNCLGGKEYRIRIVFDESSATYPLSRFQHMLNLGIRKKNGWDFDPVCSVEAADSKKENLIQVADVLMGAVGFHCNEGDQVPGAKQSKIALAKYIARKAGLWSLKQQTWKGSDRFNIWRFDFTK